MLGKIEEWIHQVNASHESVRQSCSAFQREFEGFYSLAFLDLVFPASSPATSRKFSNSNTTGLHWK